MGMAGCYTTGDGAPSTSIAVQCGDAQPIEPGVDGAA
jgi:hypothetical protein